MGKSYLVTLYSVAKSFDWRGLEIKCFDVFFEFFLTYLVLLSKLLLTSDFENFLIKTFFIKIFCGLTSFNWVFAANDLKLKNKVKSKVKDKFESKQLRHYLGLGMIETRALLKRH